MKPVALVTGASSGFGLATAERLAQAGFRVFGTSRSARSIANLEMLEMDVCDVTSVNAAIQHIADTDGRLDVLINNAGLFVMGSAEETSIAQSQALMDTNILGPMRVIQAALPMMRLARSGRIINVASLVGVIAIPGEAAYSASKFALVGYSEALRLELSSFDIHVSVIEPGFYRTNIEQAAGIAELEIPAYDELRKHWLAYIRHGLQHGNDPQDVAELIVKVARTPQPRLHYVVGSDAKRFGMLKRFLPERLLEAGMKRTFTPVKKFS